MSIPKTQLNPTELEQIVQAIIVAQPKTSEKMADIVRRAASKLGFASPNKSELLATYERLLKNKKITTDVGLRKLFIKRAVRTLSGVSIITVLTKPFLCPGKCVYCPTERGMPKSYLSNEPAAQRAMMNTFDPFKMVQNRIKALEANGHEVDKIELIVLGGTWSAYPKHYQTWFVTQCFNAANTYGQDRRDVKSLAEEQLINETAKYKIIGLTLETRPDHINPDEVKRLRTLGCTRVQLGVQHTDNAILDLIKRGDTLENAIAATKILKEVGLKVDHHYMPDLPGSTPAKDLEMFDYMFTKPDLQPDQIKIYPCVVNEFALLNKWYEQGKYKPYEPATLAQLLLDIKKIIPPYARINRLIRDIPGESIIAGNKVTNLRQYLAATAAKEGWSCKCIHCREVRGEDADSAKAELVERTYRASEGIEHFLSFESPDQKKLYAFLRLRFNDKPDNNLLPELKGAALVRELHVYGQMTPVRVEETPHSEGKTQHRGFGTRLMERAEELAKQHGFKKNAVISGIGVRNYYRKLGYELEGTYMVKTL
jgi:ELP3 family radical SAM enzyme/protein acetyltransferase